MIRSTFLSFLITASLATGFISCKKKGEEEIPEPPHEFKSQPLQGKIHGQKWKFTVGRVIENPPIYDFSYFDTLLVDSDSCTTYRAVHLSYGISSLETKIYPFGPGFNNCAFRNDTSTGPNIVATRGAVEILSIDRTKNLLRGRIDAFYDSSNYVNGEFTIKICPWK